MKQILYDNDARLKLLEGAAILAKAVGSSLGPRGTNTLIDYGHSVSIVHDGVTIARAVESDDTAIQAGIRVIREATNKQVSAVGDGTTVVTLLAEAILRECITATSTGTNPMSLRQGLEDGQALILRAINALTIPVKTLEQKIQIATISAEDSELGKQIGELVHKVGNDGVITVDESKGSETYVDLQEGMQFENGYLSAYLITDAEKMTATVEKPRLLLTDKPLNNISEMMPLLKQFENKEPNLVIIAPDVTDTALASMVVTKIQGGMNVLAVRAPYSGQQQKDFLNDIAILTGGVVVSEEQGRRFESVQLEELGRCDRVTATDKATLIVGGKGDKALIKERIISLRSLQERAEGSDYQQEKIRERIAKLTNGIAVVKVGGATEIEMKERKERAIDAVAATQSAVAEGIVAGGETVYLLSRGVLDTSLPHRILYNALAKPFYTLLEHGGLEAARYIDKLKPDYGVDVTDGKTKDFIKAGIIDPARVSKEAIKNAISVAVQLMTTSTLITDKPKEEPHDK